MKKTLEEIIIKEDAVQTGIATYYVKLSLRENCIEILRKYFPEADVFSGYNCSGHYVRIVR